MQNSILFALLLLGTTLFAQPDAQPSAHQHEISTDLSGAFMNNFRLDFNRKGNKRGAWVVGLRLRSEYASVSLDTNRSIRWEEGRLGVSQGERALDLSIGVKSYLQQKHPQRGVWFQLTALTSLAQWRSNAYEEAIAMSFYPEEYRERKRMFGLEGDIGYRYVFDNGLSLNAFVSWTTLLLRSELISERFTQRQRETAGLDGALSGSFLTLGYVW